MARRSRELFTRHAGNPILTAEEWPYPANAVFNAGVTEFEGETLLLIRVEDLRGLSHLCVARSANGFSNWRVDPEPTFPADPENYPEEIWGVEDPRITRIDGSDDYLITYTAYSESGPLVALARTKDFKAFERLGPIMPPDDKDAAIFPVRFGGRWLLIHRPTAPGRDAHMSISFSPDLIHWGDFKILMRARHGGWWDAGKIGLSGPPLRTDAGWLVMYHGVRNTPAGSIYRLGLALLDLEEPTRVLRRGDEWVFGPKGLYERQGDVEQVVFPCGWILDGDEIRLYYGAADTCMALASGLLSECLDYLMSMPPYEPI